MRCFTLGTLVAFGLVLALSPCLAQDGTEEEPKVICDKEFMILSPGAEQERIGSWHLKAVEFEDAARIEITEELSMDYRGKKAGYRSIVTYQSGPPLTPEKGSAETEIDGQYCMTGTVEFQNGTVSLSCVGLLDERTGTKLDPPQTYEKKDAPRPEGTLVFQSCLPAIGPRFIAEEGEIENVVFVEFPDDIGFRELINFKDGCRIVRDKPDADGRYFIRLFSPYSDEPMEEVQYDKDDRPVSISLGELRLVELEEEAVETP